MTDDGISAYAASLPEASGAFEGTVGQAAYEALEASVPDLFPVEISTGEKPLPAGIAFLTELTIRAEGDRSWTLPVDHVELYPGQHRAVVWVRRTALPSPSGKKERHDHGSNHRQGRRRQHDPAAPEVLREPGQGRA